MLSLVFFVVTRNGKRSLDPELCEKIFRCWYSTHEGTISLPLLLSAMLFTRIFLHFLFFFVIVVIIVKPAVQVLLRYLQRYASPSISIINASYGCDDASGGGGVPVTGNRLQSSVPHSSAWYSSLPPSLP